MKQNYKGCLIDAVRSSSNLVCCSAFDLSDGFQIFFGGTEGKTVKYCIEQMKEHVDDYLLHKEGDIIE